MTTGGGQTIDRRTLYVNRRPKPDDYIYTEDEVFTFKQLEERIKQLEDNGGSSGGVSGVSDVTVNGASIVTDGVANIPKASAKNFGVVMPMANSGIVFNGDYLNIAQATPTNITSRNTTSKPITPHNLDNAVKCAMCDGKGAQWTSDEKASARERMGIDEWEVLADMTLTEDVNTIEVATDMNGNSFQVRKMRLTFIGSATDARLNIYSNPTNALATRNMQNVYFYQAFAVDKSKRTLIVIGEQTNAGVCSVNCCHNNDPMDHGYSLSGTYWQTIATRENKYLDRIKLLLNNSGLFLTGMRIIVEGVR